MDVSGILLICFAVFTALVLLAVVFGPIFGWHIAAKHEEFLPFGSPHVPRKKIREAFIEQGWTLVRDQPADMMARTKTNWRSWGEIVSLQFRDGGAAIKSQCSFPAQVVDYGKNRMNVQNLIEALKKEDA